MKISEELKQCAEHFRQMFCDGRKCAKCDYSIHINALGNTYICPSILLYKVQKRAEEIENATCKACSHFDDEKKYCNKDNFCYSWQKVVDPNGKTCNCYHKKREVLK